ncbi:MAG TPA: UDP-2,3-diacylglucosamine diphosphatase [Crenotrichaceae bacterium]|nr:UDP-2,3-diacylglucosamine diphosphatase [Crenotrichaceae bacterium]
MNSLQVDRILFISDLHLSSSRPEITALFLSFLKNRAREAAALYILGDLFDFWVGDDDPTPPRHHVSSGIKQLVETGTDVFIMQGNRDFLLSENFANECGGKIINDCQVIDCGGIPTLLMHGDLLCTDDLPYQTFRELSRTRQWQENALGKPLWLRLGLVRWYRMKSYFHKRKQAIEIMDVADKTVWQYCRQYNVSRLIHGHTHRPGYHNMGNSEQILQRYVLGDWGESARILALDSSGIRFETISLNTSGEFNCQVM